MNDKDFALTAVRAMERRSVPLRKGKGQVNILSIEGCNLDGTANANLPNQFTDARLVILFDDSGQPYIAGKWDCTTIAGKVYTFRPLNPEGAAMIALGYQRVWKVRKHRGHHLALCQDGGPILITRDKNKDYKRTGDKHYRGPFGINLHGGYDFPKTDIKTASAGCGVIRSMADHEAFMRLVLADPDYLANKGYVFGATVIEHSELAADAAAPKPIEPKSVQTILQLTPDALRKSFPSAPQSVIDAFVNDQASLAHAGILDTPERLAYCFANLAHETGDFSIRDLTESINYSAERMAQVWPNRFRSASDVRARYGTAPGWQKKAFDDIYGNRMGNRPGTDDGSRYIGRGGPQVTGREGYRAVGERCGLPLEDKPELACAPEHQPAIAAAFWAWKNLNQPADAGDFLTVVKRWNGGTNGLADRQAKLKRILPIARSLARVPWSPGTKTTAGVVVATTVGAVEAKRQGVDTETIILIAGAFVLVALAAFIIIRNLKKE